MKERRKHPRYPISSVSFPIKSSVFLTSKGAGVITNISISGVQIETNEYFSKREEIAIGFPLPNGEIIEFVKCVVMWIKKKNKVYQIGVKFKKLSIVQKQKIRKYLKKEINLFKFSSN